MVLIGKGAGGRKVRPYGGSAFSAGRQLSFTAMARKRKGTQRGGLIIGLSIAAVLLAGLVIWLIMFLVGSYQKDLTGTTVRVPDIAGLAEGEALAALKKAQLEPRQSQRGYNDKVAKGHVYGQEPEAGMMVRPGRTVRYMVSLGKANFTVPDLAGKTLDEAAAALRKAGLALGGVQRIYSASAPAGRIVNQSPKLGESFTSPINVDVVVADTRDLPQVTMPDLYGIALSTAEETLTRSELNLQLALVQYVENNEVAPGTVLDQKPGAGEQLAMASKVEVAVAVPSEVKQNPHKRLTLRIPVPAGPPRQAVIIKVQDDLGERTDFSEQKKPGEIVERTVDVEGNAVVRIFVGDEKNPLREERL
jgi:eukaryotic-like serine/threonine-protein kinase